MQFIPPNYTNRDAKWLGGFTYNLQCTYRPKLEGWYSFGKGPTEESNQCTLQ